MNNLTHKLMGVINITPNSFSDGGKYNIVSRCRDHISKLIDSGVKILDVGAESTAPFNQQVSEDEEWKRIEQVLIPALSELRLPNDIFLSLDTYKIETIQKFIEYKLIKPESLIWNDVSGVIDDDLISTLKQNPNITYIYCHTRVPTRDFTQNHMDFVDKDVDIVSEVKHKFNKALEELGFHRKLILDPCFGFSKTLKQNYKLLEAFSYLVNQFDHEMILGISRKSFLKELVKNGFDERSEVELLQYKIVQEINRLTSKSFIIRLHNPALLVVDNQLKQIFETSS